MERGSRREKSKGLLHVAVRYQHQMVPGFHVRRASNMQKAELGVKLCCHAAQLIPLSTSTIVPLRTVTSRSISTCSSTL